MPWKIEGLLDRVGLARKTTTGFAFSGGGARGFSHIGAMRAFEEFGIRPDIMAGVSAGSIAATLYGAGLSPEEIVECFSDIIKFSDMTEIMIPKEGLFKLDKFARMLEGWLPVHYLEEMPIPTVVCATDLDHGKSIGWMKGEIVPRVLASCSIPIVFPPQVINGVHYVDGGVLRNLPAWAIREQCTTLYGINCSPLNRNYHYKDSILDIAMRTYALMAKSNTLQDLNLCDHVIMTQSVTSMKTFQVKALHRAVTLGYDDACRTLQKIMK